VLWGRLQALVEREWVQAGHPFGARTRAGPYAAPPARAAPTFALLLDCIRQFLEQFPCSFEYRQSFLITLFEHAYASQFGEPRFLRYLYLILSAVLLIAN
jgi:myotubularin-related protein 9